MQSIIKVENISKRYRLGARAAPPTTLRDVIVDAVSSPLKWIRNARTDAEERTLWALRDVSFEVGAGETVGIIGHNGAGKSTLLKILSRITKPTSGKAELYGRVGSLLEVGTGFHAELTGRENIFLSGAILGMRRSEIEEKFDEIVDFAGMERFLDTPVKHYSSGMNVRLGFAIAAHLEPEILIVDEVLAVGDVEFQKKCLGKMDEVTNKEGRTVLFVSHNMGAVRNLCRKGLLLHDGRIQFYGEVDKAIHNYLNTSLIESDCYLDRPVDFQDSDIFFQRIELKDLNQEIRGEFTTAEDIYLSAEMRIRAEAPKTACYYFAITDQEGRKVFSITDYLHKLKWEPNRTKQLHIRINRAFLVPQAYTLTAGIVVHWANAFDWIDRACSFTVIDSGTNMTQLQGYNHGCVFGSYEVL